MEIGGDLSGDDEDEGEGHTEAVDNKHEDKGDNPGRGLASVMAKILSNKVPRNSRTILAKGLTEREIQKKKNESSESNQEGATVALVEKVFFPLYRFLLQNVSVMSFLDSWFS